MNAEERHDLKENELAGWIYRLPMLARDYGSYVLFGVALLFLAWQLVGWYKTEQTKKLQAAWNELSLASGSFSTGEPGNPAQLRTIIDQYDIKPIKALAYAALGDFYLDTLNLGEPPPPRDKLKITTTQARQQALDAYNTVVTDYADQSLAVIRAHLGLGRLYEEGGQWDKARQQYQSLINDPQFSANPLCAEAQRRLDHLADWQQPETFSTGPATQPDFSLPSSFGPMGPTLPAATAPAAPTTLPTTAPAIH